MPHGLSRLLHGGRPWDGLLRLLLLLLWRCVAGLGGIILWLLSLLRRHRGDRLALCLLACLLHLRLLVRIISASLLLLRTLLLLLLI